MSEIRTTSVEVSWGEDNTGFDVSVGRDGRVSVRASDLNDEEPQSPTQTFHFSTMVVFTKFILALTAAKEAINKKML